MDGSDGRTDLRMSIPEHSACFVRTTAKPDGSHLLLGARLTDHLRIASRVIHLMCRTPLPSTALMDCGLWLVMRLCS